MKVIHAIAFILVVIGAINWGLVGAADLDVVAYLPAIAAKIVYILVGLSGILLVFTHKKDCKSCETTPASAPTM